MKKKYTLEKDGFVGYWHPVNLSENKEKNGHEGRALIVFPGSGADYELTKKARSF